jgi:hypothetical protein
MDEKLLRALIRFLVNEVRENPRVSDQLKDRSGRPESGDDDDEESNEASGAGAIAGPMLPLGTATPGKKKRPGWR